MAGKAGKPPIYNQKYHDDWAWSLAIRGATDQEIAKAFGVSRMTIHRWKLEHETFAEALSQGKEIADSKVEKSLYKRACGMEVKDLEQILETDEKGKTKLTRQKITTKNYPPDTMAAMYWLNNRRRATGEWSQRQEVAIATDTGTPVKIFLPAIESDEDD